MSVNPSSLKRARTLGWRLSDEAKSELFFIRAAILHVGLGGFAGLEELPLALAGGPARIVDATPGLALMNDLGDLHGRVLGAFWCPQNG
jgi:hypothetical protein